MERLKGVSSKQISSSIVTISSQMQKEKYKKFHVLCYFTSLKVLIWKMSRRWWNHSIDVKWEREWDIGRVTESAGARRVGPVPTYPTLTAAAACRERSAAFPEGNAEEGGRGSLLFRSPHTIKQTEAATWEGQRQKICFHFLIMQK